jgi:hypothetical protein
VCFHDLRHPFGTTMGRVRCADAHASGVDGAQAHLDDLAFCATFGEDLRDPLLAEERFQGP